MHRRQLGLVQDGMRRGAGILLHGKMRLVSAEGVSVPDGQRWALLAFALHLPSFGVHILCMSITGGISWGTVSLQAELSLLTGHLHLCMQSPCALRAGSHEDPLLLAGLLCFCPARGTARGETQHPRRSGVCRVLLCCSCPSFLCPRNYCR